jgi:hypothetical protein
MCVLSSCKYLEDFLFRYGSHSRQRHVPLSSLFFALLLHSVAEYFCARDALPVKKVGWHCASGDNIIILVLVVALLVHGNGLAHDSFLLHKEIM